jgi:hypothetical protein
MDKCIFIPVKKRLKNHFLKQPVMKEKSGTNIPRLNYRGYCPDPCPTASRRRGTSDPLLKISIGLKNSNNLWILLGSLPDCVTQAGNQQPSHASNTFQLTVDPAGIEPATL